MPECMPESPLCLLGREKGSKLRFDSDPHRVTAEDHRLQKGKIDSLGDNVAFPGPKTWEEFLLQRCIKYTSLALGRL